MCQLIYYYYAHFPILFYFILFFKDFIYFFLERGEGREKERERNISVWLPLACAPLGTWPTTWAYALPGNRTCDPLVCRPALNPLSYTSQGYFILFILFYLFPLSHFTDEDQ